MVWIFGHAAAMVVKSDFSPSNMDISENSGTPKSSILIGVFHYFHHPFWGTVPLFLETPIYLYNLMVKRFTANWNTTPRSWGIRHPQMVSVMPSSRKNEDKFRKPKPSIVYKSTFIKTDILLMSEFLNHLGCPKLSGEFYAFPNITHKHRLEDRTAIKNRVTKVKTCSLSGRFQRFFWNFHPDPWGNNDPIWRNNSYFSEWVEINQVPLLQALSTRPLGCLKAESLLHKAEGVQCKKAINETVEKCSLQMVPPSA